MLEKNRTCCRNTWHNNCENIRPEHFNDCGVNITTRHLHYPVMSSDLGLECLNIHRD